MTPDSNESSFQRKQDDNFDRPRDSARNEKDDGSQSSRSVRRNSEGTDVGNPGLTSEQHGLGDSEPNYSPDQSEDERDGRPDRDKVSGPSPDQLGFGTGKGFVQEGSDFGRQQRQAHGEQEQDREPR